MQTTTTMIPMTEAATATGPSLCCTRRCADVRMPRPPTHRRAGGWAATVGRTAPWAGAHGTTVSQSSGDNRTMTSPDGARVVTERYSARRRSARCMLVLDGSVCVPVLLQQRVAVGIMLRAADPLPPVQERLLGEPAVLGCSL